MIKCIVCGNQHDKEVCPICGFTATKDNKPIYMQPGGKLKSGRYMIGQVIGAGGFGITYSAWDTVLNIRVAIKEYLPGEFSTRLNGEYKITVYGGEKEEQYRDGLNKFFEESQRLAKFRDIDGIVKVFDCFKENETAYIVMEFLTGETLSDRLNREKKIPVDEAMKIIIPVLKALEAVHAEGIIHRDISPGNIFICDNGDVKLLDFGAARSATGTHSKSLTVLYKEGFTAEEQYRSRGEQGPWTDVYATAATFYKAVTGVTPDGAMERRLHDKLKYPSKHGIKISGNIETSVMNALNVDYTKRTQSASQFRQELEGEAKVKKRLFRTKETKVGKIPKAVWISSGILASTIAVILVLLLTGVIQFYPESFSNLFVASGKARVMNLINMEESEARERLGNIGLGLEITDLEYSNDVMEGRIISQEESKGTVVDEGTSIHVIVSAGAATVQVPSVIDKKLEEVEAMLDELKLKYEISEQSGVHAPGYIAECEPSEGSDIEQGQTVKLYVSTGMEHDASDEIQLDDYTGQEYEDIRSILAEHGVYITKGDEKNDDNVPVNMIMAQRPSAGETVKSGTIVTVDISLGIEQKEVPHMVGLDSEEAQKMLTDLNLTPVVKMEYSEEITPGQVMGQSVAANQMIDKYSEVTINVATDGYIVPNLSGLSQADAERICNENGFKCVVEEVLGGDGNVKSQTPAADEILTELQPITIQIGIPESEFTQKLIAGINAKRAGMGMGSVSVDGSWSTEASKLADSGKVWTQPGTWRPSDYGVNQVGTMMFWATRSNITTVSDAVARFPWTSNAFGSGSTNKVGIAYRGTTITMLIGY